MAAGDLVMFQQMGFGLAVAIFIDATIVRTIIVPAAMELLGDWNWYLPRWLEWLPNVSVEGHVPAQPGDAGEEIPATGMPAGTRPALTPARPGTAGATAAAPAVAPAHAAAPAQPGWRPRPATGAAGAGRRG